MRIRQDLVLTKTSRIVTVEMDDVAKEIVAVKETVTKTEEDVGVATEIEPTTTKTGVSKETTALTSDRAGETISIIGAVETQRDT